MSYVVCRFEQILCVLNVELGNDGNEAEMRCGGRDEAKRAPKTREGNT